jgi:hypothetical protein
VVEISIVIDENPALEPWTIDVADFPSGGTMAEAIAFCVRYAVLAPSGHNTQPWWFAIDGNQVVVGLDPSRGLAVLDPDDREATISVGAAVFMLRVALGHFGFSSKPFYWPDPHDPEACVRLEVLDVGTPDQELAPYFDAITRRHTSRMRFLGQPVPQSLLGQLAGDARAEGAELLTLTDYPSRRALAELVSAADLQQMDDRRFRRELASWLRPVHTRRGDGIRGYGSGLAEVMSVAAPLVVRTFDVGEGRAARDVELATGSPVIAVLATTDDDRTSWLRAGQALARMALRATAANVLVGFLDQPVEVAELRNKVAALVGTDAQPQLVLRLGYGAPAPPQPRRPLADALARR